MRYQTNNRVRIDYYDGDSIEFIENFERLRFTNLETFSANSTDGFIVYGDFVPQPKQFVRISCSEGDLIGIFTSFPIDRSTVDLSLAMNVDSGVVMEGLFRNVTDIQPVNDHDKRLFIFNMSCMNVRVTMAGDIDASGYFENGKSTFYVADTGDVAVVVFDNSNPFCQHLVQVGNLFTTIDEAKLVSTKFKNMLANYKQDKINEEHTN